MSVRQDLDNLSRLARLMDDCFRLPGTRFRFGVDALIGLIPGIGDAIGALIALIIMAVALKHGASTGLVLRMLVNIGLDFLLGAVPVAGDVFDFAWKANRRNLTLLYRYHGLVPPSA